MIWNEQFEAMDREELQKLQTSRLQQTITNVYENVAYYRELFDQHGVKPTDIQGLEDIGILAFTRNHYPTGIIRPIICLGQRMNKAVR